MAEHCTECRLGHWEDPETGEIKTLDHLPKDIWVDCRGCGHEEQIKKLEIELANCQRDLAFANKILNAGRESIYKYMVLIDTMVTDFHEETMLHDTAQQQTP